MDVPTKANESVEKGVKEANVRDKYQTKEF